jgi:hypothetical protein
MMTYRPSPNIAILLAFYDMVNNNKRFVDYITKSIARFSIPTRPQINDNSSTVTEDRKKSAEIGRGNLKLC